MSAQDAASFAKLQLPASARDFQVYTERGIDQYVMLRFRMAREDLAQFRAESNLPKLQRGYQAIQPSDGKRLNWNLDRLTKFSGVTDDQGSPIRSVMVDLSDPSTVTVYVESYMT